MLVMRIRRQLVAARKSSRPTLRACLRIPPPVGRGSCRAAPSPVVRRATARQEPRPATTGSFKHLLRRGQRLGLALTLVCVWASLSLTLGQAGEAPTAPEPALPLPAGEALTNRPVLKPLGSGLFELGTVRFDKQQRSVSFPARLNRAGGLMEYFLVTTYGKTHESILQTEASPVHIHLAMLLLNATGACPTRLEGPPAEYGGTPGFNMSGDPITVEVSWREKGKQIVRAAEDLVSSQATTKAKDKGRWVYNGSVVWEGTFLAESSGSLISLITDPVALINRLGPRKDEEQTWTAKPGKLPPASVPVQVTIRLTPAGPKK
jgi:hypothetical protein